MNIARIPCYNFRDRAFLIPVVDRQSWVTLEWDQCSSILVDPSRPHCVTAQFARATKWKWIFGAAPPRCASFDSSSGVRASDPERHTSHGAANKVESVGQWMGLWAKLKIITQLEQFTRNDPQLHPAWGSTAFIVAMYQAATAANHGAWQQS